MMVTIAKSLILMLFTAGIIVMAGCSSTSSASSQPPAQTTGQQSSQQLVQQNTATSAQPNKQSEGQSSTQVATPQNAAPVPLPAKTMTQQLAVLSNRIDVVYFHPTLRCATCLCFEKQVSSVIKTYFQDKIDNGKLTYRILNIQDKQNAAIAKKYGAVGSQLFINNVINDFDNIEDIQDIWSWNCVDNPSDFDMRVKSVIELYIKGKR